jgi:hypothetical protein
MQSDSVEDRERAVRLLSQVTNGPLAELSEVAQRLLPPPGIRVADHRPKPIETVRWGEYTPIPVGVGPQFTVVAGMLPDDLWAAAGSTLFHYLRNSNQFEVVAQNPPLPSSTPITALNVGGRSVWVGTAGGGLLQLSRDGAGLKRIGSKEGLPSLFVRSVACLGGRAWTGFGTDAQTDKGGFGYYDLETERFTTLTPAALVESGQERPDGPPAHAVKAIKAIRTATLWVLTDTNLKRYDIEEDRWSQALPFSPRSFSVAETFVTATSPTGAVLVCQLPGNTWKPIPVSNAPNQQAGVLRNEGKRTWFGVNGRVRHLDIATETVIGGLNFQGGDVRWLSPGSGLSFFIADGPTNGTSMMYKFYHPPKIIIHARE